MSEQLRPDETFSRREFPRKLVGRLTPQNTVLAEAAGIAVGGVIFAETSNQLESDEAKEAGVLILLNGMLLALLAKKGLEKIATGSETLIDTYTSHDPQIDITKPESV